MRVLIIKTSSLGDIIHTLPAVTDAMKALPGIEFDWLVEDSLQAIPKWHPAVHNVIAMPFRRLRKFGTIGLIKACIKGEGRQLIRRLQERHYDIIIDAQGLFKSIIWLFFIKGFKTGFSFKSAREPLASLFYHKKIKASWLEHAVVRNRILFAGSLNYALPTSTPDYGIQLHKVQAVQNNVPSNINAQAVPAQFPYIVFLHGTAWVTKLWPTASWIELGKIIEKNNLKIKLFWGNKEESERAHEIARQVKTAEVLPKVSLEEAANILAGAKMVVSLDTGFGHLAAALNVPTISLYGATDPKRTGIMGMDQATLKSDLACAPCFKKDCRITSEKSNPPPCLASLTPKMVWHKIQELNLEKI